MAVHAERMCAQVDGDFVVFLIGTKDSLNAPCESHSA
jgi:hypothetical protein